MTSKTKPIEEKKKIKEEGENRGIILNGKTQSAENIVFAFKKNFLLYICGMDKI